MYKTTNLVKSILSSQGYSHLFNPSDVQYLIETGSQTTNAHVLASEIIAMNPTAKCDFEDLESYYNA